MHTHMQHTHDLPTPTVGGQSPAGGKNTPTRSGGGETKSSKKQEAAPATKGIPTMRGREPKPSRRRYATATKARTCIQPQSAPNPPPETHHTNTHAHNICTTGPAQRHQIPTTTHPTGHKRCEEGRRPRTKPATTRARAERRRPSTKLARKRPQATSGGVPATSRDWHGPPSTRGGEPTTGRWQTTP